MLSAGELELGGMALVGRLRSLRFGGLEVGIWSFEFGAWGLGVWILTLGC